jgi:hypothetical protein
VVVTWRDTWNCIKEIGGFLNEINGLGGGDTVILVLKMHKAGKGPLGPYRSIFAKLTNLTDLSTHI